MPAPFSVVDQLSDEDFLKLVKQSFSVFHIAVQLDAPSATKKVIERLETVSYEDKKHLANWKPKYEQMSLDELKKLLTQHTQWNPLFRKMGYPSSKGLQGFKRFLTENGIDFSHINGKAKVSNNPESYDHQIDEENVLDANDDKENALEDEENVSDEENASDENTKTDRITHIHVPKQLKDKLINESEGCCLCGHNNKRALTLDHIDGNHLNNTLSNFRILCANCHRKTDTYGSKNTAYLTENQKKDRELRRQILPRYPKTALSGDIFVYGKSLDGPRLLKRLVRDELLENKCNTCHLTEEEVLTVDHINGDHKDNRIENLQILCENCHRLTDTWGSRNTAYLTEEEKKDRELRSIDKYHFKRKKCPGCEQIIWAVSDNCVSCASANKARRTERPTLETLLKLLETNSYRKVGQDYGVTDNAIKKWIRAYGEIPPAKHGRINGLIKKPILPKIVPSVIPKISPQPVAITMKPIIPKIVSKPIVNDFKLETTNPLIEEIDILQKRLDSIINYIMEKSINIDYKQIEKDQELLSTNQSNNFLIREIDLLQNTVSALEKHIKVIDPIFV